jgi:H+/Cl- antiporter ClcA
MVLAGLFFALEPMNSTTKTIVIAVVASITSGLLLDFIRNRKKT